MICNESHNMSPFSFDYKDLDVLFLLLIITHTTLLDGQQRVKHINWENQI